MVLAAKIFLIKNRTNLDDILIKVRDHKSKEIFERGDKTIELLTEVRDLNMVEDSFNGVFAQDQVIYITHHGEMIPTPRTMVAPFIFNKVNDIILLTVLEKKRRANLVANSLSKVVYLTTGQIVEAKISPETLQKFHQENFEDTKIIFFDDVDIPNINKLSLYGSALGNTALYTDYLGHGKLWYTVISSKKYGHIVGITRNCGVTVFSKVEQSEFINYIKSEIFPLISVS